MNIKTIGAAALLGGIALIAPAAHAGELHWSGNVDDTAIIRVHGDNVLTRANYHGVSDERSDFRGGLPHEPTYVTVRQERGRGRVEIIEQPNPRNNFTAVVRVRDWQPGADRYAFTLQWRDRDDRTRRDGDDRWRDRDGNDHRDGDNRQDNRGYGHGWQ